MLQIHQRRYLGAKSRLLPFIKEIVTAKLPPLTSFADLFAGTGVVGHSFNRPSTAVMCNELLYANYLALDAFLGSEEVDMKRYIDLLDHLSSLRGDGDGYMVEHFGGRYFGARDSAVIGAVRQGIDDTGASGRLRSMLITSLLYSMDRIANTCGHYDAFRKQPPVDDRFRLLPITTADRRSNTGNRIFNEDANTLVRRICPQVIYLDPPYNSRQYADAYHVLENVARWEKPRLYGKARKFDRKAIKSDYNKTRAVERLADLVSHASCEFIILSYSNMSGKGDPRSRNRISDMDIMRILSEKGAVSIFEQDFQPFSTGKSRISDHKERIFLCSVGK